MGDYLRQQGFGGTNLPASQQGINPFSSAPPPTLLPPPLPYGYEVQTSYDQLDTFTLDEMDDGVVPAVPLSTSASTLGYAPQQQQQQQQQYQGAGTVPSFPSAMPFASSTALPTATGKIGNPSAWGENRLGGGGGGQPSLQQPQQPPADSETLLGPTPKQDDASGSYPFYNIRRYRPLFDVDTKEVLWRVGNSFIGAFSANFMLATQERPDLYGPFWICTTLIFVTCVAGNFAGYIQWQQAQAGLSPTPSSTEPASDSSDVVLDQWFTDYTKLSASAAIFYGYTFVVGLGVWLVLRYFRSDMRLAHMFCIYGYALSIFMPISLICVVPSDLMRWLVVLAGTATSGLFLFMNLRERILAAGPGKWLPLLLVVLGVHAGIGVILKLFFFSY